MTVAEAGALIAALHVDRSRPNHWLELGCGTGTFTRALAELLPPGSTITAVDSDEDALRAVPATHNGVRITALNADVQDPLPGPMDGVLLANVLHFVEGKEALLARIAHLTRNVVIIEYDTARPLIPWVPFPLPRIKAVKQFANAGFDRVFDLGERPSRYGNVPLYAMAFSSGKHPSINLPNTWT
ncbi:MAG: class I SAM-dependent methyltransferase [Bacteroidetes bacterium]|nr:class I SAM-dependent methyltransferase [Bacteroidota bacterium]MBS1941536.1 class I SAM-dependent methyltransferase [Bacteroidota bacterium]